MTEIRENVLYKLDKQQDVKRYEISRQIEEVYYTTKLDNT